MGGLFPAIRNPRRVGEMVEHEGRRVLLDYSKSPTDAFLWANGLIRGVCRRWRRVMLVWRCAHLIERAMDGPQDDFV